MKLAKAAEMREIDRKAINDYGIPGAALMESAGRETARKVEKILKKLDDKKICVFCGKGNNGGDGYVIARYLYNKGAKVTVILSGSIDEIRGDAQLYLNVVLNTGIDIIEPNTETDWDKVRIAAALSDCLVDALLGTGFKGEVTGIMADFIEIINESVKPVVAVDIPSGIDADTGAVRGCAVKASHTVSFALPKPGLIFQPGAYYAGKVTIADIGIPVEIIEKSEINQNLVIKSYVNSILPVRLPWGHKGSSGRALIVGGSEGLSGAAALAGQAALKAGAGLVTLAVSAGLNPIMEAKVTEVMTKPLPETAWGVIGLEAAAAIEELASKNDVLALGPGLGQNGETFELVRRLIKKVSVPLVIDADALNALAGYTDIFSASDALIVITPHPGELSRLTSKSIEAINADRLSAAKEAALNWGVIVILKGPGTVIAFPDGETYVNSTGSAALAAGGTGDVLTGIIAAFIAQGLSSYDAAISAVYIHGLSADITAKGAMIGLTASDCIAALPAAIDHVKNFKNKKKSKK